MRASLRRCACGLMLTAATWSLAQPIDQTTSSVKPPLPSATPAKAMDTEVKRKLATVLSADEFARESTMLVPAFKEKPDAKPGVWAQRIQRFFRWLADVLRAGVWVLGAIAVAIVVVGAHYYWRIVSSREKTVAIAVPTHIGGLDIRAESLPDDVGGAAWQRWQAGDGIGCLSLLYRAALSALVLRFRARIIGSSTEAECERASAQRLSPEAQQYFVQLTETWIRAVYAGRPPAAADIDILCVTFKDHFVAQPAIATDARTRLQEQRA